ncbi:hemerythrin domain-containing protein [soil metagenome]
MADITQLILDDHDAFRRRFAELDDLRDQPQDAAAVFAGLAAFLEVHASAEEVVFYPALLKHGEDAEEETEDAVGDHDDIRDGVRRAAAAEPGSQEWWQAVDDTRAANTEHMSEEEDEALADFRRNTSLDVRHELGLTFTTYKEDHPGAQGLSGEAKGAEAYLEEHT